MKDACFLHSTFMGNASFLRAAFKTEAELRGATFSRAADFRRTTFAMDASFYKTTFEQNAEFHRATFFQEASYSKRLSRRTRLSQATFNQAARFVGTEFHARTDFRRSRFLDLGEFRRTRFLPQTPGEPSAIFALARFSKPGEIIFDDVDLSRAIFHNTEISLVWLTSSVRWGKREGKRGFSVFEEEISLDHELGKGLQRNGQRDYAAILQIYQQLKKNYDSRLDHWTANEFHFGEMEMKRLILPANIYPDEEELKPSDNLVMKLWTIDHLYEMERAQQNISLPAEKDFDRRASELVVALRARLINEPSLRLRRFFHEKLSLTAFYSYASDYGNSYRKPLFWMLVSLVLFAALLPIPGAGLKMQGSTSKVENYETVWDVHRSNRENLLSEKDLAINSLIASVDTAMFQKSPEFVPAHPWGRVLAIAETLFTSSLFALFLLAIRRRFKR